MVETIEIPADLVWQKLPDSLHARLHHLLDKQDVGEGLTLEEQREAEALVELTEFISLLNLRARRVGPVTEGQLPMDAI
jgi:hypothetical protein